MSEARRCPQCGAELAADAPEGLCPGTKRGNEKGTGAILFGSIFAPPIIELQEGQ